MSSSSPDILDPFKVIPIYLNTNSDILNQELMLFSLCHHHQPAHPVNFSKAPSHLIMVQDDIHSGFRIPTTVRMTPCLNLSPVSRLYLKCPKINLKARICIIYTPKMLVFPTLQPDDIWTTIYPWVRPSIDQINFIFVKRQTKLSSFSQILIHSFSQLWLFIHSNCFRRVPYLLGHDANGWIFF